MVLNLSFDLTPHACGVVADAKDVTIFDAASLAGDASEPARLRLTWREAEGLHRLIGAALRDLVIGGYAGVAPAGEDDWLCVYCHEHGRKHAVDCPLAIARGVVAEGETP